MMIVERSGTPRLVSYCLARCFYPLALGALWTKGAQHTDMPLCLFFCLFVLKVDTR